MTLESILLVPLLDYRAQADRHGIRVEVTVRVPEETFDALCAEVHANHPPRFVEGASSTVHADSVAIGGVRFETERT